MIAIAVCGGTAGAASAATRLDSGPVIVLVKASLSVIPGSGGTVVLRVRVRDAVRCTFFGQRRAGGTLIRTRAHSCASGRASVAMAVAPNPFASPRTITFAVAARDRAGRTDRRAVHVTEAAAPPAASDLAVATAGLPAATTGTAYSETLTASGGEPPYRWASISGNLPPGLLLFPDGLIAGTPSQTGSFSVGVRVADSRSVTARAVLTIDVGSTQVPTNTSANWAGYVLAGGPFAGVAGTFNVPQIAPAPDDSVTAEWVGIGGYFPTDPSIVQAGVQERYSAATASTEIVPWVELYPAPAFSLPLAVAAGDQVTVTIKSTGLASWDVIVRDDTSTQSLDESVTFSGGAQSAEWIVEAPFSTVTHTVMTIGHFSPVTFSRLAENPNGGSLSRQVMNQRGQIVASPSPLSTNGFTVAYGAAAPPAP